MAIKVLKPGLATTVQDLGRPGYYHIGIPLSGGMDRHALAAANLLVGNAAGAAVLEARAPTLPSQAESMCPWFSARARPTRWVPSAASRVESSRPATNYRSVRLRQR